MQRGGARVAAAAMSGSAAVDGVVSRDEDDLSLVFVDHVSPRPAARASSVRLPGTSSPGPVADSSLSVASRRSLNNYRRKSQTPSPRLTVTNTPLPAGLPTPRPSVRRTSIRRKSVAASQPVAPEPDLHHGSTASSLRRPDDDGGAQHGVGYRLGRRKVLAERRKRLADYSLVFAMFGVVSMMVETELTMAELYDKVRCSTTSCRSDNKRVKLAIRC